jgi:beta-glucosidase
MKPAIDIAMRRPPRELENQRLETEVHRLLSALSADEKLSLCAGRNFWSTRGVPRLGIKPFGVTDGPRGVAFHSSRKRNTAYPSGIALAASWDPELARQFGEALGEETRATGARMILGPAVNICRTPLNGRTFEYFTEDPHLNSRLAVATVKGIQSQGVAACIKHYAANNQETYRMRNSSELSERALREIYLPAFEAAVREADVWSVMAAYNAINGIAACENKTLLNDVLRDEFGFRGFVVSDWFAVRRTSSGAACVKAGLSLEMPGKGSRYRFKKLKGEYDAGDFSEQAPDAVVAPLLRVMLLTGHIEMDGQATGVGKRLQHNGARRNSVEHVALARRIAAEGITLLKNEQDLLPIDTGRVRKIALLGPKLKARNCLPLWGGSAGVWPPRELTPLRGMTDRIRRSDDAITIVERPEEADLVILFVGLSHRFGGDSEAKDRKHLALPEAHDRLVEETLATNPNTVVVLMNGSPVTMPWVDKVPAIVEAWYPGMMGGGAIADVLFGDVNPSGKLPVSFPRQLEDCAAHRSAASFPGSREKVCYEEDVFVGYRHFDRENIDPLFAFGHGLSYTRFEYDGLLVEWCNDRRRLLVSMRLANVGDRAGAEVVQLYIRDFESSVPRPDKELKAFRKVHLDTGESQELRFELDEGALAFYSEAESRWCVEAGGFEVLVGASSRDIRLSAEFQLHAGQPGIAQHLESRAR